METAQHLPSVLDNLPREPQTLNEKEAAARLPLSQSLDIAADLLSQLRRASGFVIL